VKHIKLRELDVSRIGLGAMGMSAAYTGAGSDDAESVRTIHRALELGVTLLDTAEVYGPYTNEELLGRAIQGRRDQVVVATKFGMISHAGGGPGVLDSSPANIRTAVEGSLRRLGTDTSTCTTSTASTPTPPSRTPSACWPNWSPRARSATSACPRPG
jgi:aryl-alcohol dehydrogenase-like predicted oxidoreductase